jgi:hypothetical protein
VRDTIINSLMFNITWLAIVMTQSSVLAPGIVVLHLLAHFALMGKGQPELRLIVLTSICGFALDQLLFRAGIFTLAGVSSHAPVWLSCLWPVLATTLMHTFSGLSKRLLLAVAVGAIGGAASYTAGTRMSEVAFGSAQFGPLILASLWAILFPLLLRAAQLGAPLEVARNDV